ncbi:calponin homology domain-containing protein DDB_G0272472 isoform X6 [Homalodisca vitripennis]|uniref:calponin homology domain-containing protein DDB_G0272472 isoform X6 n=1 Tax=Homalodisca vitripennis TaxID=197043 RepID=UPI001EEC402C|nr:calponin homology domain-containing protein DDB_G0272472 isoform X6 [Homalodisca vitripennis]
MCVVFPSVVLTWPPVFIYNMPAVNPNNPNQGGPQRTTFRPPWVKEGPTPLPMPTAPWTARGREATAATATAPPEESKKKQETAALVSKLQPQIIEKKQETAAPVSKLQPQIILEKKQETAAPVSKLQPQIILEKKQETPAPVPKLQPQLILDKKQQKPTQYSKPQVPVVVDKVEKPAPRKLSKVTIVPSQPPPESNTQEVISQANLKWKPKSQEKKQENSVTFSKPLELKVIEKKQETLPSLPKIQPSAVQEKEVFSQANLKWTPKPKEKDPPSTVQFTAKRPSAFIKSKEGAGQSASGVKDTRRRESTTTVPVVIESKRKQSTDKPIPVVVESKRKESTDRPVPVVVESKRKESTDKVVPVVVESTSPRERKRESVIQVKREPEKKEPPVAAREFAKPTPKPVDKEIPKSILKDPSKTSVPSAPKPPPPPMAPPLPPPPPANKGAPMIKSEITPAKAAKLEALRSRPRRRPDWTDMMKEVESGRQLRHVHCNDRSAPILPKEKAKGQFVYESEKDATQDPHKQLLSQIQSGVKLKRVKCNDRSKPNLDGLRKFRRQMTIEEQIQKSMSMADVVAVAAEPDELDDIDKVRDDLQSTKQMLAQELRNKEALERENKRLMARLLNLEVELEKEKNARKMDSEKGTTGRSAADEKLVNQLKDEAAEANRVAKEMEDKYRGTAEELDATRAKLESAWLRNQQLEQELKSGARGNVPITKQPSSKKLAASMASMPNGKTALESDDESEYTEETETETESEEEGNEADAAAVQERRIARELKLLATKLRSYKEKQAIALKERHNLREQLRKQQKQLRQEKKKYKALQKEVDKMAKLMKDDEEEGEEEEEEEKPEDEEEEEETESESESEESEEDDPTDGDLPEDATVEAKRKNLTDRSKHHETRLGTLKKGNYLLKANIDRLQDDINRQREMSLSLQEDLNSVLAELG